MHRMVALDQEIAQMRPDEACAPGDEESHLAPVDHAVGVEWRLCFRIIPPNPPRTRIATPPARSTRIEPPLPAEPVRELDALSTDEGIAAGRTGALAASALEPPTRPAARAFPEPECDDPAAPGGPMPAPNRGPDGLPREAPSAPICLARLRGSAYSLAAGEPGS